MARDMTDDEKRLVEHAKTKFSTTPEATYRPVLSVPHKPKPRQILLANSGLASVMAPAERSAHHGMSVGERWPDPIMAWPAPYVNEVMAAMAKWSVRTRTPLAFLFSMCCRHTDPESPEAKRWPYLLYVSTRPFRFEERDAFCNVLADTRSAH